MKLSPMMIKILSDRFVWVGSVLVGIILVVGYILFLSKAIDKLRTSGWQEQVNVKTQLAGEQQYLADLQKSIAAYQQALPPDRLKEIDTFLPRQDDFPNLIITLENIARAANLSLEQLTVSAPTAGVTGPAIRNVNPGIRAEEVQLTVSGGVSYETVKRFLALLESSRRILDVVSINFSHQSGDNQPTVGTNYVIALRTYYLPDNK